MPRPHAVIAPALALVLGATWCVAQEAPNGPLPSDLVEETETHLVQIEVVVSGPAGAIEELGRDDFGLWVHRREIDDFTVDKLREPVSGGRGAVRPATYVFYFDQTQLSAVAREQSLDLAREIVPRVIDGTDRGMVVSSGRDLKVYAGPTTSAAELLDAIDDLDRDVEQRDTWGLTAELYAAEIQRGVDDARNYMGIGGSPTSGFVDQSKAAFNRARMLQHAKEQADKEAGRVRARKRDPGAIKPTGPTGLLSAREQQVASRGGIVINSAREVQGRANTYYRDAVQHSQYSLERLRAFLVRMYRTDRPKSIVYFADLLRFEPGQGYLQASGHRESMRGLWDYFEQVRDAASAHGIRFYTVDGRGLVARSDLEVQDALSYFALESGGRAFLNGVAGDRIAEQMTEDLHAAYLLSFDPGALPTDRSVFMTVAAKSPEVSVLAPAHLYIESADERRRSELLAAYVGSGAGEGGAPRLSANVIPLGYHNGKFHALVQLSTTTAGAVSPLGTGGPTWDMGATLVSRGKVREKVAKRISVGATDVPVTFESEMAFRSGPFELVAVAHQIESDNMISGRVEGSWPVLDGPRAAAIGPIAVVQPSERVLVRDDAVRTSGTLALGPSESVRTDLPTGLVTVVCADPRAAARIVVLRTVRGETEARFDALELEPGRERCALLTDVVPKHTLRPGSFTYTVDVRCGDASCAAATRDFAALSPRP